MWQIVCQNRSMCVSVSLRVYGAVDRKRTNICWKCTFSMPFMTLLIKKQIVYKQLRCCGLWAKLPLRNQLALQNGKINRAVKLSALLNKVETYKTCCISCKQHTIKTHERWNKSAVHTVACSLLIRLLSWMMNMKQKK